MAAPLVVRLISLLDESEIATCLRWLRARHPHQKASREVTLFEMIVTAGPDGFDPEVARAAWGGDANYRPVAAMLKRELQAFLVQARLQPSLPATHEHYLQALIDRQAWDIFLKEWKRAYQQLRQSPYRDLFYYRQKVALLQSLIHVESLQPTLKQPDTLLAYQAAFERLHAFELLYLGCTLLAEPAPQRPPLPPLVRVAADTYRDHPDWLERPAFRLLLHIYDLLCGQPSRPEAHIWDDLRASQKVLRRPVLINYFTLLQNRLFQQLATTADPSACAQVLSRYVWGVEQKFLFEGSYLPAMHFRNPIALYLRLGAVEAAQAFQAVHKRFLAPADRPDNLRYTEALIAFWQGAYGPCLAHTAQPFAQSDFLEMSARILNLLARTGQLWQAGPLPPQVWDSLQDRLPREAQALQRRIGRLPGLSPSAATILHRVLDDLQALLAASDQPAQLAALQAQWTPAPLGQPYRRWMLERIGERVG